MKRNERSEYCYIGLGSFFVCSLIVCLIFRGFTFDFF